MNKTDIIKKLEELGIEFDPTLGKKELLALLPDSEDKTSNDDESEEEDDGEIIVKDPKILQAQSLPLVVTLPKGSSKAQQAFVNILNAYAYQNPTKWAKKKDVLIAQLKALKNAPDPVEGDVKLTVGRKLPTV